jgi:hypothetical protein
MPPSLFSFHFWDSISKMLPLPRLALSSWSSYFHLHNNCDYRCALPHPAQIPIFDQCNLLLYRIVGIPLRGWEALLNVSWTAIPVHFLLHLAIRLAVRIQGFSVVLRAQDPPSGTLECDLHLISWVTLDRSLLPLNLRILLSELDQLSGPQSFFCLKILNI